MERISEGEERRGKNGGWEGRVGNRKKRGKRRNEKKRIEDKGKNEERKKMGG